MSSVVYYLKDISENCNTDSVWIISFRKTNTVKIQQHLELLNYKITIVM